MEDNEIIKALECCTKGNTSDVCVDCPLRTTDICTEEENGVLKLALDLLNRQQAEIERLKKHNAEYKFCNLLGNVLVYSKNLEDYNDMRNGLISYGRRTFAEKLKEYLNPDSSYDFRKLLDNLAKKMGENVNDDNF